ncbi:MAG TPA: flagellar basal body-associated FliL family protein [Albitalea sp.]|nr:flagellar basal body-associated FliL family protein [Albitalea sp.]HJW12652.1 flagellar basal body-associated FliL family protein [Albitalea sp.]
MSRKPTPRPDVNPETGDPARPLYAVVILTALVGGLVGAAAMMSWVDGPRLSSQPTPQWVMPSEVRGTTQDGTLVKARVALDVASSSNRHAVESRMQQVDLVLQLAIGGRSRRELTAPDGVAQLAADMRRRLNAYLAAEGADPVRAVAIQDIWYTSL